MKDHSQEDLEAIKRLLVVLLLKLGATSEEIGLALHMHPGAVRKMIPTTKVKKIEMATTSDR
ncbi:MAG: hypothetical protein HY619_07605 [Thaumarchaeota archaeon]|nr:hypothetical protein [Nitrososphaerota archaeon]